MQTSTSASSPQALAAASGDPVVLRADKPSSGLSAGLRHTSSSHHNSNSASPDGEAVLPLPPLALKGRLASLKTSSRGNLAASKRGALRHLPLLCFLSILLLAAMSLWGSYVQVHTGLGPRRCESLVVIVQLAGGRGPIRCIHCWLRLWACSCRLAA